MTQEEKELVLKDLCARLPYRVKIQTWYREIITSDLNTFPFSMEEMDKEDMWDQLSGFKPYLRPMSSMTEEEKKELLTLLVGKDSISYFKVENNGITNTDENIQCGHNWQYHWLNMSNENISLYVDWLNSHYFDYRGLIEKGLALEAPEGMYKLKNN